MLRELLEALGYKVHDEKRDYNAESNYKQVQIS